MASTTVEDALHEIFEKAAMLEFFMNEAADADGPPEEVFFGVGTVCSELAGLARASLDVLDARALGTELPNDEEEDDDDVETKDAAADDDTEDEE